MSFEKRLKEARLMNHLTQEELAKIVSVSKGAIGNYESGVSSPNEPILIKLMQALNVDANFLYQDYISVRTINVNSNEYDLLTAYRKADPGTQASIRKLLDIPDKKDIGQTAI